jgi:hypothetical protein
MPEVELQGRTPPLAVPRAVLPREEELFMAGPPMLVEAKFRLLRPGRLHTMRRCFFYILLAWAPLALITALEGTLMPRDGQIAFLADMGAFARSWVAGPLLLAADVYAGRELSRIAGRFGWMASMSPSARAGFERIVDSTLRLRDGIVLEVAVAGSVLLLVVTIVHGLPLAELPVWYGRPGGANALSAAGWWYSMVSLPMLMLLLVGWMWRLVLWTRFLVLVSRLDLPIVPEHPDRAGGMGFLGYSVRGFAFVAAAFGAIVAGSVANEVLHHGASLGSLRNVIGGTAGACVLLFCAPLCVFAPRLAAERRRGLRQFGELATNFGLRFGEEWFHATRRVDPQVLDRNDFSAATDLYQVVDRVQAMRFVPLDRTNVLMLAGAALVPFAPVALLAIPVETLVKTLFGLLV